MGMGIIFLSSSPEWEEVRWRGRFFAQAHVRRYRRTYDRGSKEVGMRTIRGSLALGFLMVLVFSFGGAALPAKTREIYSPDKKIKLVVEVGKEKRLKESSSSIFTAPSSRPVCGASIRTSSRGRASWASSTASGASR